MDSLPLSWFLLVAGVLFVCGVVCMATKRNGIGVLMGVELVLNGANIDFVAFSALHAAGNRRPGDRPVRNRAGGGGGGHRPCHCAQLLQQPLDDRRRPRRRTRRLKSGSMNSDLYQSTGQTLKVLLTLAWLLPLAGFAVEVFGGYWSSRKGKAAAYLAVACIATGFCLSVAAFCVWGHATNWQALAHVEHPEAHAPSPALAQIANQEHVASAAAPTHGEVMGKRERGSRDGSTPWRPSATWSSLWTITSIALPS